VANRNLWREVEAKCLTALDIRTAYRELGLIFPSVTPLAGDWHLCCDATATDGTPTAAVNVGSGPARGRWRSLRGHRLSLNLWEFAARSGHSPDRQTARRHYAQQAGIELPFGTEPPRPADAIEFLDRRTTADGVLKQWAHAKGGFGLTAIHQNGGVFARYPAAAEERYSQCVVAFPTFHDPWLADAEPTGWVLANSTGESVSVYNGPDNDPSRFDPMCLSGSGAGLLGAHAVRALSAERDGTGPAVEVVWKVADLYDLLTLHAALAAAGLLGRHVVFANSIGPLETVEPEWAELLDGKTVYVVHDSDRAGRIGAGKWVEALARRCHSARDVHLPFEFREEQGDGLREFLHRDQKSVAELLAIASATRDGVRELPAPPIPSARAVAPTPAHGLFDSVPDSVAPPVDAARVLQFTGAETTLAGARPTLAARFRLSLNALSLARAALYPAPDAARYTGYRLPDRLEVTAGGLLIPLTDACGTETGFHLVPMDGGPALTVGSGIVAPSNWDEIPGIVVVAPDPLDALALWTVGVCAVALPNLKSGLPTLIESVRERDMAERGWFCVGESHWATEVAQALCEAGTELSFWNRPPGAYTGCYGWVFDRIPLVTSANDLDDLGNTIAGRIEVASAHPGYPPRQLPVDLPPPACETLPPAAVAVLCPEPAYRKYLSATARTRGILDETERLAAQEAALAAANGDEAEKNRWVRIGERVSAAATERFAAVERAARGARPTTATAIPENLLAYVASGGRICERVRTSEGGIEDNPFCNFVARIVSEAVHDDGAEAITMFQIEGAIQDGTPLPVIEVRADEYDDMEWVTPLWGARAIVYATRSARNHLRVAIQYLSGRIPRRTVYAHTGWRQIGGRWVYLHAGGAVSGGGAVANVAVQLPDSLIRFRLPAPPLWGEIADIRASLALLTGLAPDRTVYPLYAATWRAVLGDTDLTVALNGLTGSFKSELAALAQRHLGVELDARHLPANWSSTANALEAIAHAAKDALLTIDDFCPPAGPEAARYHQKADQVLRGAGNGAGRQRMRADTTLRPAKPPRCLIVSTGEESPRGQSLQARMMQIDVAPGTVNAERLTECQRDAAAGRYARAMAAFLRWLAPQYARVKAGLVAEVEGERDLVVRSGQHRRTPAIVAELTVGLTWFLRFAQEVGAVTPAEALGHEERCRTALEDAAGLQTEDQASEEPAGKFVRLLAAAIAAGRCHVADFNGAAPGGPAVTVGTADAAGPGRWGWRLRSVGVKSQEWQPLGPCVGWVVGEDLYLEPDASFAAAVGLARDQGDDFHVGARTIRKRLWDKKLLASRDKDRGTTVRRSLAGVPDRTVLHLRAAALAGAGAMGGLPVGGERTQQAFDER